MPARPLRLLQVNPTPGWRGGEAQTLLLCRGLSARGHDVLLAAAPGEELARRAERHGVKVSGVRVRGDGDLLGIAVLGVTLARFRPDLVHLHTSRAHAAGWTLSFFFPRLPLVVSRRVDFTPAGNPLTRLKYRSRIARFITVSERIAEVLRESGVRPERIRRVYSGVPSREAPDPRRRAALRSELGLPEGEPLIGTVGALAPHKDPLTLLSAFARVRREVPNCRLVYVGDGELRGAIETRAAELGLAAAVTITGFREDPIDCLSLLDVFAASSHLEGLNTSVLDAMSLGAPIVATRAGGIPELVVDGECGLLAPPRDGAALATALLGLLRDRELARRLGDAASVRAADFSEERMVRETESVYDEVLSRGGGS